jgi:hypothetical protein
MVGLIRKDAHVCIVSPSPASLPSSLQHPVAVRYASFPSDLFPLEFLPLSLPLTLELLRPTQLQKNAVLNPLSPS